MGLRVAGAGAAPDAAGATATGRGPWPRGRRGRQARACRVDAGRRVTCGDLRAQSTCAYASQSDKRGRECHSLPARRRGGGGTIPVPPLRGGAAGMAGRDAAPAAPVAAADGADANAAAPPASSVAAAPSAESAAGGAVEATAASLFLGRPPLLVEVSLDWR